MFIHELPNWTDFSWNAEKIALLLDEVCREQGRLYGRLSELGFDNKLQTMAENLTRDVVHSSEIEGIVLNLDEVRSSIARRLGIKAEKSITPSHYVEAVVAVMLDAVEHYDIEMTKEKLCAWQSAFFPTGYSEGSAIEVGKYRTNEEHIVSGFLGHEHVHYVAPAPERIEDEMANFIQWYNSDKSISPVLCSAIAHFWFVSIHPFEDGNGRLSRVLSDMYLARADKSNFRFYSMSSEINRDKNHYYEVLEQTQHGDGDITAWLEWYLRTLLKAIQNANSSVSFVLNKNRFWLRASGLHLSERQTKTLNLFLDGYEAKITSKSWASLNKCSKDTAIRDIQDLVQKGILCEDIPGAKRPCYSIVCGTERSISLFTDVKVLQEGANHYLTALYKGVFPVRERLLSLDAERYEKGDIPLSHLLEKYCSYLMEM
jgi:Fic family protein